MPTVSHAKMSTLIDQCNKIASIQERKQGVCECIAKTISTGENFSHKGKEIQFSSKDIAIFKTSTFKSILDYEKGEDIADKLYKLWGNCEK